MESLAFAIALLGMAYMAMRLLFRLSRPLRLLYQIPSPPAPAWLMGHFSDIAGDLSHLRFKQWADALGPIFRLRVAHKNILVVTDKVSHAATGN